MTAETSNARGDLPSRDESRAATEQGLFRKFDVRRTDGSDAPGGKHHGCEYFVLDMTHDPHAKAAAAAYADSAQATHPQLATDMRDRYGLAAPPPAAARGDVRGLVALAKRVQYADTHAQVSKDDAGEFVCLPPWLWLEIRDAAAEALAAEGVQAGEVEERARELLAAAYDRCGLRGSYYIANPDAPKPDVTDEPEYMVVEAACSAIASALSQQPEPKAEARGVVGEAMVVAIADHVRKWMGPIGRDLSVGHVATLHGAIVDGIHAAALTGERNG